MLKNYEARHFFMVTGIAILFISPILLVFIPTFIGNSLYYPPGTWIVIIPKLSYILYGTGCLLLVIAFFLMYFANLKKYSIIIGTLLIICGLIFLAFGTRPFIAVANEGISMRLDAGTDIQSYTWQEVDHINFYSIPRSEGFNKYEFNFQDGNSITLTENGFLMRWSTAMMDKFREENLAINWK